MASVADRPVLRGTLRLNALRDAAQLIIAPILPRSLVSRIELVSEGEELAIVLRGDLAAILTFASGKKNPDFLKEKALLDALLGHVKESQNAKKPFGEKGLSVSQVSLVAGAGFEPAAFRL